MKIPALAVKQWLIPEWDEISFGEPPRTRPEPHFYIFSISARTLKKLTGVYRRDPSAPPAEDMGIQRRHMPERSEEILRYIQDGFPLSRIDRKKLVNQSEVSDLRMPGWLPTSVVVNILTPNDHVGAHGTPVATEHLVKVAKQAESSISEIEIPDGCLEPEWAPAVHPIEVIDGQHRLWALEEPEEEGSQWSQEFRNKIDDIEIPVVAFYGLDRTWQAYLFYTINQLAKRIDTSMVFDLYPLLRTEDWLLRFEGPNIYRESRAQDLTILLWSQPESPWKDRIIRLGGREKGKVAQAAFVRSLAASFIKRWDGGTRTGIGGLYGALKGEHQTVLNWGREQQAAFLIMAWQELRTIIINSQAKWATDLIGSLPPFDECDDDNKATREKLFSGPDSLLASDQGVRGYLCVINDILWQAHANNFISLTGWAWERGSKMSDQEAISNALETLRNQLPQPIETIQSLCTCLSDFDWRMSSALSQSDAQYTQQAAYRGSGGYKEIRRKMLAHIRESADPSLAILTAEVIDALNYEPDED